jgi:hypothetical protein
VIALSKGAFLGVDFFISGEISIVIVVFFPFVGVTEIFFGEVFFFGVVDFLVTTLEGVAAFFVPLVLVVLFALTGVFFFFVETFFFGGDLVGVLTLED